VITPAALEVSVLKGPVLDARFGQVALHVRGKVLLCECGGSKWRAARPRPRSGGLGRVAATGCSLDASALPSGYLLS